MNKTKESALDRFLKSHRHTCAYFVFSGDRHCSCGRDEAIAELQKLRSERITQMTLPASWFVVENSMEVA